VLTGGIHTIVFGGWRFEITAMDERRVQTARMAREPTPEDHS
jgi:CBS domain containing-hemolysin-like protein